MLAFIRIIMFRKYIIFFCLFFITASAQSLEKTVTGIENGIRSGDARMLNTYLAKRIEASILNKEGDFGKQQVFYLLKEFFTKYPPSYFTVLHRGQAGDTHYLIGVYNSVRGNFDVSIFFEKTSEGYKIEQLRFEKEQK